MTNNCGFCGKTGAMMRSGWETLEDGNDLCPECRVEAADLAAMRGANQTINCECCGIGTVLRGYIDVDSAVMSRGFTVLCIGETSKSYFCRQCRPNIEFKKPEDLPALIRARTAVRGPMDWSQFIGALRDLTDEEIKSLSEEKFDDTLAALRSMPADDLFNCPKCGADYHYLEEETCAGRENEEAVEFYCRVCETEFTIAIHWRYMVEVKQ